MTTRQIGVRRWLFIAAVCYAVITPPPVLTAAAAGAEGEQMTVPDSPYTVRQQVIEPSIGNMSKMELRQTSVSKSVTYSDLDLSKDADVAILKERARKAARDACRLADRHADSLDRPVGVEPDCVTSARQQALANVNRIVADARAGRTLAAK